MTNPVDIEELIRQKFYGLLKASRDTPVDAIPISDLNIDSLEFFEFIIDLEKTHKISIPIESFDDEITLSTLISSAKIK
jgi:acyl carrier protein